MTKTQVQLEIIELSQKIQRHLDAGQVESAKPLMNELRTRRETIADMERCEAELRAMREAEAKMPSPMAAMGIMEGRDVWRTLAEGMREKRSITAGGAGIGVASGIIRALVDGGKLRSKVSVFPGKNAQTVVPVFSPHMAIPVGTAPGATGTSSDSTAVLAGDTMNLKPWYATLPIGMDAIIGTDIEAELPRIFQEAFGAAIDKGILVGAGSGSDMLGTFVASSVGVTTSQDVACGSAGVPVWSDVVKIVLQVLALGGQPGRMAVILNPTFMANLLAENTEAVSGFKNEYLQKGTILGVDLILSSHALTTTVAGSYVGICGDFSHYGLAVAAEITVDAIKTVGSDNITFQSFMYMQGKPIVGSSFRRLKTI